MEKRYTGIIRYLKIKPEYINPNVVLCAISLSSSHSFSSPFPILNLRSFSAELHSDASCAHTPCCLTSEQACSQDSEATRQGLPGVDNQYCDLVNKLPWLGSNSIWLPLASQILGIACSKLRFPSTSCSYAILQLIITLQSCSLSSCKTRLHSEPHVLWTHTFSFMAEGKGPLALTLGHAKIGGCQSLLF